jgi:hypothetical protein
MSDHTPGPWTVEPMDNIDDVEAAKPFAYVIGPDDVDPWAPPHEWRFKVADAHLIAAAPDLLAALEKIAGLQETTFSGRIGEQPFEYTMTVGAQSIAHAAIAKAIGARETSTPL